MTEAVAFDVVSDGLADVHRRLLPLDHGAVASYIPQLALAEREDFGVALVSMDGHRYQAGRSGVRFTIQAVAKPFVYALALAERGPDEVGRWVGQEPGEDAFHTISLEDGTGRPANAMVDAGAVAAASLVPAGSPEHRFARVLDALSAFAGRRLDVDEEVCRAEAAAGDRTRALARLMHAAGSLRTDPDEAAEGYFRQCAVRVDTVDLAVMAATLAAGGVNPVTGVAVVPEQVAVQVLAVMAACGRYEAAGDWLMRVGLPAVGGVSGGLAAASPGRFGIAAYSPPLDPAGNPVRAVAALRELSERFGLHLMRGPAPGPATVPVCTTAARVTSGRERAEAERTLLARDGQRIAVVAARGELDFTAAERLLYALAEIVPVMPGWVVLDLAEVGALRAPARGMLAAALSRIAAGGHRIALVGTAAEGLTGDAVRPADRTEALAWAEDALLRDLVRSAEG